MRRLWKRLRASTRQSSPRTPSPRLSIEELEPRALLSATALPEMAPLYNFDRLGATNSTPRGLTPSQVRHAYGFDQISFSNGAVAADGRGQTIAIVDAYDDPAVQSDLAVFDAAFSLSAPPSFRVVNQTGGNTLPTADAGWAQEIALDVEWAHAVAPAANLLLVEADSNSLDDLLAGVDYARNQPGVEAVSMSWGAPEFAQETSLDSHFVTPAGHAGITFVVASGDNGSPGGWPAVSPNVVAVGGTRLSLNADNSWAGETGWSGSGGGTSQYESRPGFQASVGGSLRSSPDVAYNADPASGFAVYDSVALAGQSGWLPIGGTSAGAPQWAALVAILDQGRALAGQTSLDGFTQTLPALYNLSGDFHDVTSGSNGLAAGAGYDKVTGLGTPTATLITQLVTPGLTPNQRLVTQLYHDLLQRDPDSGGLLYFSSLLDRGGSRQQVASILESSAEYRAREVQGLFQSLLGRSADAAALDYFVQVLGNGGTVEQVKAALLGSAEYYQKLGGTDAGFLAGLYHDALGRDVDAPALAYTKQLLASGVARSVLAAQVVGSQEAERHLVDIFYQQYLHRSGDAQGLSAFAAALAQGTHDEDVIAVLLGSSEYFTRVAGAAS